MHIIIPGQTRSKKNSKVIAFRWGNKKRVPFLTSSAIYHSWAASAISWIKKEKYPAWGGDYPLEVKFFLFRKDRTKWDIDNVFCGALDILQQTGIIEDDSASHVIPIFSGWAIDRQNPRVELMLCKPTKTYYREDLYVDNLKKKKGKP